jgi:acetyl esterase/lipase
MRRVVGLRHAAEMSDIPYGYLTNGIVVTILTLCALRPARRPGPLAGMTFVLGLAVSELPQLAAYLVLGATVVTFAQGEITSAGAWAAVAFNALPLAGLVVVAARARRAGPVLDAALSQAFGRAQYSTVDGTRWLRVYLWPWRTRPRGVCRVANVPYADGGGRHTLDVYHHRSKPVGGPVLIHLHGGAFQSGRKSTQAMPLLHDLAGRGWVCVSANYRLRRAGQWPAPLVDAKRVIAWAHRHAADYGGDPAAVFVAGSSAGAHLAALAGLTPADPRWQLPGDDTTVSGVIGLGGYYGRAGNEREAPTSPRSYVRPDAPPFLVVHGRNDSLVPVSQARGFVAALRESGAAPVVYAELPGGQHAFDLFHSVRFNAVIDAVASFASAVLSARTGLKGT